MRTIAEKPMPMALYSHADIATAFGVLPVESSFQGDESTFREGQ
jgi:hypothetical protein